MKNLIFNSIKIPFEKPDFIDDRECLSEYLQLAVVPKLIICYEPVCYKSLGMYIAQLKMLFNENEAERNYHEELQREVKDLMDLRLFQQYTPAALREIK